MRILDSKYLKNVKALYVVILFILYMVICFFIPTLVNNDSSNNIEEKQISKETRETNKIETSNKINLLLTESNQVVELNFEDYIKGVLIGEVPITYNIEALKAQAVVARTYTMYKLKNAPSKHAFNADMCDDINCCQAYKTKEYAFASWDDEEENEKWSKLEEAVNSTKGEVIVYQGELINAFFHAHSGGTTENVKYLWSKNEIPYLVSVAGNEGYIYQDSKAFTKQEMKQILKDKIPNIDEDINIIIKDYTGSGRVNNIEINGTNIDGASFRSLTGIKSTNFRVEQSGDSITIYTVGYGHGIGMSQEGANQMAIEGKTYEEIIKHYYTGVEIVLSGDGAKWALSPSLLSTKILV